jgi:hypothetical protein
MNCREAQERMVDLFDIETPGVSAVEEHLAACPRCAADYAALRSAARSFDALPAVSASPDFKERVMRQTIETEPGRRRWQFLPRCAPVAAAALAALLFFLPRADSPAARLMAQSAEAMSNLTSVHIAARMRGLPHDNFEVIDPQYDWVPLEIWKEFGATPRWRVEKPGRVAVMDGTASLMVVNDTEAVRGGKYPGFLDWVGSLLDTGTLMDRELNAARAGSSSARLAEQDGHFTLTVQRAASAPVRADWLFNKTVSTSDNTRVYRFDAATKRLESMQVVLNGAAGDVPVFEIASIRYNDAFDPAIFTLPIPKGAVESVGVDRMPAGAALPQSAKETAAAFFDALARQDGDKLLTVYPASAPPKWAAGWAGGELLSLGEPFASGPGYMVPYEYRFPGGHVKKFQLAVRNDNPQHRWTVDGGF